MSHLKSHVALTPELAGFYDEINEAAEGQGVHPGTDGVNVKDVSDSSSLDALVAVGAATVQDTPDGKVVRLIGSPEDEEENHGRTTAVAKDSQFAEASPTAG